MIGILSNFVVVVAMFVLIGLLLNLLGYRIFRLYSALIGILAGMGIGTYVAMNYGIENPASVVVVASATMAFVFWLVYRAGLFVTGAVSGYFLGVYLLPAYPFYAYALAAFAGVATVLAERAMMVLITALIGATLLTMAVYMTINGVTLTQLIAEVRHHLNAMFSDPFMFLLWLSVAITGVASQLTILKEKGEES